MEENSANILFYMALGFMGTPLIASLLYGLFQYSRKPKRAREHA
jgi:hypothetical protein